MADMTDFMALFHLIEYLNGFNLNDTSIETIMLYLECDLEHYTSKENKTLRDKFEIIQIKFFMKEIDNICNTTSCKTSKELEKLLSEHLELNYME